VAVFEFPPALAQTREYEYVLTVERTPVEAEPPLVVFDPDQSPEAVHDVGEFVVVQVRVELTDPDNPDVGLAERVTTGTVLVAQILPFQVVPEVQVAVGAIETS
jgi:hypothetical protein